MSQGETDAEENTPEDEVVLDFTPDALIILHNLGFNDDFLEILNGRTLDAIQNDYLIVLAAPIEQGGFNLEIDNIQEAIDTLDEETKTQIAGVVLNRLGPQGGKRKKRTNKKKMTKRRTKRRKTSKRTNKRRTKRRRQMKR